MVSRPCLIHSRCPPDCPESGSPYGNLSAEAPDPVDVIAIAFYRNNPGINFNNGSWTNISDVGVGRAISRGNPVIDKQIADQGALRDVQGGIWSGQQRGIGPPPTAYGNSPQTTTIDCPGGGSFDYTIPPGTYLGQSQVEADELAASYLEDQAFENLLCIDSSEIADSCINQPYSASLAASGGSAPYEWNVTDGSLPTGLTLDPFSGSISGTPTAAGSYTFTITVSDQVFNSQSKQFTISVFQISPATFPSGIVGTAYSKAVSVSPALGALTLVGSLPPGLTFSGSAISGTPTLKGTYNFTLRLEYGELICNQSCTLKIWDSDNTLIGTFLAHEDNVVRSFGTLTAGVYKISWTIGTGGHYFSGGFADEIRVAGGPDTCGTAPAINVTGFGNIGVTIINAGGPDPSAQVAAYFAAHDPLATTEVATSLAVTYQWQAISAGTTICGVTLALDVGGTDPSFAITRIGKP